MTTELKQLLTEQVRPEVLQRVIDLIEGKTIIAESFKGMAIECDNDEQMADIVRMAESVGLNVKDISPAKLARYFSSDYGKSYSNYSYHYPEETPIHYTDFVNQFK
jgi:hypothetical protein